MKTGLNLLYVVLAIATLLPTAVMADDTPPKTSFGVATGAHSEVGISMRALVEKLRKLWSPNCDVPGANQVQVDVKFSLSTDGHIVSGPSWTNPTSNEVWIAGANRAMMAVKRGEPYDNMPDSLYNVPITITFDAKQACPSQ